MLEELLALKLSHTSNSSFSTTAHSKFIFSELHEKSPTSVISQLIINEKNIYIPHIFTQYLGGKKTFISPLTWVLC